MFDYIINKTVK